MRSRSVTVLDLDEEMDCGKLPELYLDSEEGPGDVSPPCGREEIKPFFEEEQKVARNKEADRLKLYAERWQENETSIVLKMLDDSLKNQDTERLSALKRSLLEIERKSDREIDLMDEDFSLPPPVTEIEGENNFHEKASASYPPKKTATPPSSNKRASFGLSAVTESSAAFSHKEEEYLNKVIKQNIKHYDEQIIITIIGNGRTGKTSLMNAFVGKQFEINTPSSFGLDTKTVYHQINNKRIKFKIIDTDADKSKEFIRKIYYDTSNVVLVLFNLTDYQSFADTNFWINSILKNSTHKAQVFLVGSKLDLRSNRVVSLKEASLLAKSRGLPYSEVSMKDMISIEKLLSRITSGVLDKPCAPGYCRGESRPERRCAQCSII